MKPTRQKEHVPAGLVASAASVPRATSAVWTKGLPAVEHERVQLGKGSEHMVSRQANGKDLILHELYYNLDYVSYIVMDPAWFVLIAPFKWEGNFLMNGRECKPNELVIAGGPSGLVSRGRERHGFFIPVRKKPVLEACAALSGNLIDLSELGTKHLPMSTPLGKQLSKGFVEAIETSYHAPFKGILAKTIEKDLTTQLALFLLEQIGGATYADPSRTKALAVVHKAKKEIERRHPDAISLAELCAATGVGKAWLHKCFMELKGVSPIAYLRLRRLSVARQWLLDHENPPRSVKDVSIALGFTNGGRFAASYADLFGEKPMKTLVRAAVQSAAVR